MKEEKADIFQASKKNYFFPLFATLLLVLSIPLTVLLALQARDLRSQASGPGDKSKSYSMPILVLNYFPTKDGVNIDSEITGFTSTIAAARLRTDKIVADTIFTLEEGSKYHGYKDPSATSALNYSVLEKKEFLTDLPLGLPLEPGLYRPNYLQILTDLNICDYVENQGVKEVWMNGWHHGPIVPVESNMAGPYGDISNSERTDDMPVCSKTYVLYNFNYPRGGDAAHNFGHQFEAVFNHVDRQVYDEKFVGPWRNYKTTGTSQSDFNRCGWTHNPPNVGDGEEYIYWSTRSVWTDCEDWKPDGTGQKSNLNCTRWECTEMRFHIWQWQNMPGKNNPNPSLPNWWDFIGDFDGMMAAGKKLYYDTTPPSTPVNLAASNIYKNQLTLNWNPSSDDTGVNHYTIRRDGVVVGTSSRTSFVDYSVKANTTYSYTIVATDALGNTSPNSSSLPVSTNTNSAPDISRPLVESRSVFAGENKTNYSWFHDVGNGGNRVLLVGVGLRKSGTVKVQQITYDTRDLSFVGSSDQGGMRTEYWFLANPATGHKEVKVNLTAAPTGSVAGATSFIWADQSLPTKFKTAGGFSANPSLIFNDTSSDSTILDLLVMPNLSSDNFLAANGQTEEWKDWTGGDTRAAASTKSGVTGSTILSWQTKNEAWSLLAVSLKISKPSKLGDINGDNKVDMIDLSFFLSSWDTTEPRADLNKDGKIDILDLSNIISNWEPL